MSINIEQLALDCDSRIDLKNDTSIMEQIDICFKLIEEQDISDFKGTIHYFIGNLYGALEGQDIKSLNAFREAKKLMSPFNQLVKSLDTNIANVLSALSRKVEALCIYNKIIELNEISEPKIKGLINAIWVLYDIGMLIKKDDVADFYFVKALMLTRALNKIRLHKKLDEYSKKLIDNFIMTAPPLNENRSIDRLIVALKDMGNGKSFRKSELSYREWCLSNILFLNHMNDLVASYLDAKDTITFPNYRVNFADGCKKLRPHLSIAFASVKRDYCFARYLAYEGISKNYPKYEEKELVLAADYYNSNYSGHVERLKTSFRLAFSVLDKIATLLVNYLSLGETEIKINSIIYFKPSFFEKKLSKYMLSNQYIKAMYYLSCDLNEDSTTMDDRLIANAKHLKKLRNDLEHNWVHVSEFIFDGTECCEEDYSHNISTEQLEVDTLTLLKLARSCLIYLVFAIQLEENKKEDGSAVATFTVPIWGK